MVIFAVIFAIFFSGIKKTGNSYFFPKSTFIKLSNDIWFAVLSFKMARIRMFFPEDTGGHPRRSRVTLSYLKAYYADIFPLVFWDWGEVDSTPPPHLWKSLSMTTKLEGQVVCSKTFLWGAQQQLMASYDIRITSCSQMAPILDFLIFPKPSKSAKLDQEVTKVNDTKMRNLIPYYHMVILKIWHFLALPKF